jgi:hypothetical protein
MKRTRTPKDPNLVRSEKMGFKLTKQEKERVLEIQKITKMKLVDLVLYNGTRSVNNL